MYSSDEVQICGKFLYQRRLIMIYLSIRMLQHITLQLFIYWCIGHGIYLRRK